MENILPVLHKVNASFGYISKEHAYKIADYFRISPPRLFAIITSSGVLRDKKPAQLEIQVCGGVHCKTRGADKILSEIEKCLKVKAGKEFNEKIRLESVSCIGHCDGGPVMKINGTVFSRVRPELVDDILKGFGVL